MRSAPFLIACLLLPALHVPDVEARQTNRPADQLRPISKATAGRLAKAIRGFKVTLEGGQKIPVPWANLTGNSCGSRATLTQYYLATGGREKALPAKVSNALLKRLERRPVIDTMEITLTGPIECRQGYRLPNGRRARADEHIDWYCHHGTVVNVAGKLKVIDPSISARPMTIRTWACKLVGKGAPVRHLKDGEFNDAYMWNLGVPASEPTQIVGYKLKPTFRETSIHPPPGGTVRSNLQGVKYAMTRDLGGLDRKLEGKVPKDQLHLVKAVLETPPW
jgi:hypothetical protein